MFVECCKIFIFVAWKRQDRGNTYNFQLNDLEKSAKDGDSPVSEKNYNSVVNVLKQGGTREIPFESGSTMTQG